MLAPEQFQQQVLGWFDQHGRHDLPWQTDRSPYRVWLSEIMLQQTQVKTVIPYFERFVATFPSVQALAAAEEDAVLHLWTGLGYYARARNLLKCAQQVCTEFDGEFPASIDALTSLPGIGRSTAGAIRSIAFRQPAAILDGNVKRVLARYGAIAGWPGQTAVHKELWALAETLNPVQRNDDYSQALMDLGATLCTRSRPACERCPLQTACRANSSGSQADFPGRKPKKALPVKATTMLIISNPEDEVFLARRPSQGIWGGLWSFPEVEDTVAAAALCLDTFGCEPGEMEHWEPLRHTFSHYHLDIQPLRIQLLARVDQVMEQDRHLWYNRARPESVGMAAPVSKLLKLLDI
ncbi:MAG: A/G-specific adenine glycosylase [Halieaceae bacterium]